MGKIDVSIIIPSYNSEDVLINTLKSIEEQKTNNVFEIIIIDSSPSDNVQNVCKNNKRIQFIKLKEKTLPGIARNIGAEHAKGEVLIFCDADVLLQEDVVTKVWEFYSKGHKAFGGALILAEGSSLPVGLLEHYFYNHESQKERPVSKRSNLSSALMIVDRTLFIEQGGFKNIPRMQDTEFTERISRNGAVLMFTPEVVGCQRQITTWKGLNRKVFLCGHNLYFIRYKQNISTKKKILLILGLPFLSILKMSRINLRNIVYTTPFGRIKALFWTPVMYYLGFIWMSGFYKGIIRNRGISLNR